MKSHKEVTKQRNQGFSYYFCLMIEASGSGSESESESVPRTGGWIREAQKPTDPDPQHCLN